MKPSQSIMNDQHRATPEQWQAIKANGHLPTRSTILEMLHRIEALEAAQQAHADASHVVDPEREKTTQKLIQSAVFAMPPWSEFEACAASIEAKPNHPEIPGGSLLSRVACADGPADAILEVAAWLQKESEGHLGSGLHWAKRLEQEAKR